MNNDLFMIIPSAVLGTLLSSTLACIPGLHIYNIMGLLALAAFHATSGGYTLPTEIVIPFSIGLVVGYSILNTIPAILLSAPDESAMFTVLPGRKFFMQGHGIDGVMITTIGSAAGLIMLLVLLAPLATTVLPVVKQVLRPHTHWIIWTVITFMLMSEWPKGQPFGQAGLKRFLDACKTTGVGLLTFLLAGILGFILFYSPTVATTAAFQNLMPAFVGLFTIPWLLLNIVSAFQAPPQEQKPSISVDSHTILKGSFAGALGGGFAAFFPVVTGGVGGLLAGHATALNDSKAFLISQGTSKLVYYVGALLLFFVPQLGMRRGGGAWIISGITTSYSHYEYYMALCAIAISGAIALLLVAPLTRLTLSAINKFRLRKISSVALATIIIIVGGTTGMAGLFILMVATGIGLLPILFGSRRMNCLGVILLPMACGMSGFGVTVAHWMRLI